MYITKTGVTVNNAKNRIDKLGRLLLLRTIEVLFVRLRRTIDQNIAFTTTK